ncbi:MAG: recombination protein O N-terminal domain-containing protein, partial [Synechococcus sp.]|nr:recombination protein O N-terminal domain-containing protein [Synechococcus sp.]
MAERTLVGLALKVGPLGEHDRLLSLLSDAEGVTRVAVPGAR